MTDGETYVWSVSNVLKRRGKLTNVFNFECGSKMKQDLTQTFDGGVADHAGDVRNLRISG